MIQSTSDGSTEVVGLLLIISISILISSTMYMLAQPNLSYYIEKGNEESTNQMLQVYTNDISQVGFNTQNESMRYVQTPETATIENDVDIKVYVTEFGSSPTEDDLVVETSISSLQYKTEGVTYTVESNAVYKIEDGRTTIKSNPTISYSNGSLTMPLINQKGTTTNQTRVVNDGSKSHINDYVKGDRIILEINSTGYKGWGKYFQNTLDVRDVEYNTEKEIARIEFGQQSNTDQVLGGISAEGDIVIDNNGDITGDVVAQGEIKGKENVNGETQDNYNLQYTVLDKYIKQKKLDRKDNDDWKKIDSAGGTVIGEGQYYMDELYLTDDTMTVDLEDGDVIVVVDNDVLIENEGHLRIINADSENTAEFLVNGSLYKVSNGTAKVTVDGSPDSNVVLGNSDLKTKISNKATFEGLIYAPKGKQTTGGKTRGGGAKCNNINVDVCIGANSTINGGIVGGSSYIGQSATLNTKPDILDYEPPVIKRDKILYLNISEAKVKLE